MNGQLLRTCSQPVQEELEELEKTYLDYSLEEPLTFKRGLEFYLLDKVQSEAVGPYLEKYDSDPFWQWDEITDDPYRAWYVFRLLNRHNIENWQQSDWVNEIIQWFRDQQTIRGEINWVDGEDHTTPLSLFVEARPNSSMTRKAIEYFLQNPPDLYPAFNLPVGISAVCNYDYYRYEERIKELADELVNHQEEEGYFSNRGSLSVNRSYNTKITSLSIQALSKLPGYEENIRKAADWLRSFTYPTAILGRMLSTEGPKIPQQQYEWKRNLAKQRLDTVSSNFVETSPPLEFGRHTTTIRTEIEQMIQDTEQELRICSPYVDMLHEDILDLSEGNELVNIKILTKPKGDISGNRARLAKSAIEQLNRASNREVRTNYLIHSRLVITDNNSLLVSSADLTRDQLVDEFNAGLQTGDEDAIGAATNYFDDLWDLSDQL